MSHAVTCHFWSLLLSETLNEPVDIKTKLFKVKKWLSCTTIETATKAFVHFVHFFDSAFVSCCGADCFTLRWACFFKSMTCCTLSLWECRLVWHFWKEVRNITQPTSWAKWVWYKDIQYSLWIYALRIWKLNRSSVLSICDKCEFYKQRG